MTSMCRNDNPFYAENEALRYRIAALESSLDKAVRERDAHIALTSEQMAKAAHTIIDLRAELAALRETLTQ